MEALIKIAAFAGILVSFWVIQAMSNELEAASERATTNFGRTLPRYVGYSMGPGVMVFWFAMVLVIFS